MKIQMFGPQVAVFHCPGCDCGHPFDLTRWTWNLDTEKPTFSPSLLVYGEDLKTHQCHLFVTDGKIQYLSDCQHSLAGQTVDIPDYND